MNLFGQAFMFNVAPVGVKDAVITWANVGMVDPSGNWAGIAHLGLSDAPYAYTDEFRTIEFGNSAVGPCTAFQLMDVTNGEYVTGTNAYFDSSDWRYKADGSATALFQNFFGYAYVFNVAPVGVKDAIITWTQTAFVTTTGDWLFPGTSTQYNSYKTPFLLPAIAGVSVITVASTFVGAYTIASAAAGAQTTLTSAGVHGLTAAVAVGKSIYISAGTGWPVGLATITALDSDTTGVAITVNIPYDAGMGSPTIPLGGGEVDVALQTVPGNSLGIAGNIVANIMYSEASNGVLNNTLSVYFGGTLMHQFSRNYNIAWMNACAILANVGATNVQIATPINVNYSDSATLSPSSAIDTTADVI